MTTTWRWARDGQQRLYVVGDDDVTIGYLDLVTGFPADVRLERAAEFYEAVAEWRARCGLERVYTAEELHGLTCANCGVDYRVVDRRHVAIPTFEPGSLMRSERWQLVACAGECATRQSGAPEGLASFVEPVPLAKRVAMWQVRNHG